MHVIFGAVRTFLSSNTHSARVALTGLAVRDMLRQEQVLEWLKRETNSEKLSQTYFLPISGPEGNGKSDNRSWDAAKYYFWILTEDMSFIQIGGFQTVPRSKYPVIKLCRSRSLTLWGVQIDKKQTYKFVKC